MSLMEKTNRALLRIRDRVHVVGAGLRLMLGIAAPRDSWILQQAMERAGTAALVTMDLDDFMGRFGDRYVVTPEIEQLGPRAFRCALLDFFPGQSGEALIDKFEEEMEEVLFNIADREGIEIDGLSAEPAAVSF